MPTSYTTTVSVAAVAPGTTYGDQLDSLEIVSGSTSPYELPQPPSARASFIGLPVVLGITMTPDWWIGKEVTFTIAPQGATGTVTWTGIVQGYSCSPVQTSSTDQIVELDLLGATSKLSTQIIQNDLAFGVGLNYWSNLRVVLNKELTKLTWAEAPPGFSWADAFTTWANYSQNTSGLTFVNDNAYTSSTVSDPMLDTAGLDVLSLLTNAIGNAPNNAWFWFDDKTIYINSASSYTNYSAITSLNAESCVLWSTLQSGQSLSNVVNSGIIANDDATDYQYYFDSSSYNTYGPRTLDVGVSWDDSASTRKTIISNKVKAYKQPNKYLQSLTIDLDALTHVTGEWQNFYKSTKPVRLPLTNIPDAYGGDHTYMVRGVQLNLTQKHAEATLLVVPSTIYNPS
jgi:hypothetical protein